MNLVRISLAAACAGVLLASVGCKQKTGTVVGFAQVGSESDWRKAETDSIKTEAAKRGIVLKFSDGQGKQELQVAAIKNFIRQNVNAIILAPIKEKGWEGVLADARAAGIPVVLVDRRIDVKDESLYTALICSDFEAEGRTAANLLIAEVDKRVPKTVTRPRVVYELLGSTGASPAIDRAKGFHDIIDADKRFTVKSENGDFSRLKGKEVMEAMLKTGIPDAVYAHNDDMAIGAMQAIEEAGKKPGKDIVVVSIDGIKDALQALIDGRSNACIECPPLLGRQAFDVIQKILAGQTPKKRTLVGDSVFDAARAKKEIKTRVY